MRKSVRILFVFMAILALTESCRKQNFIGEDLLPEEDLLNSERIDTFTITTFTDIDDSVVTSQNVFYTLGSINSDIYGKSTAGIYAQLLMPTNNLNFGADSTLDSIVLTLDYAGYYGDEDAEHSVSVFRMIERMESGRLYYSDTRFHVLPVPIGKKTDFVPNLGDSVTLAYGGPLEPHLRIKLFDSFGQSIINQDSTVLDNDTTFLEFLKGIYIETDTFTSGYSNGMMYFDMASTLSGVTLYYHNAEADSLKVTFPFTGVKSNRFTHSYPETSIVHDPITSPNTIDGEPLTYVQGLGGLRTIVKIPSLENLKDVSINNAEITFYLVGGTSADFPAPPKLMLVQLDSAYHNFYYLALYNYEIYSSIIDDVFGSHDIGGIPSKQEDRFGRSPLIVKYNITRHVQEIIEGSIDNNGFALICFPGNRIPNSVTLAGNQSQLLINKPYLSITYTTVNK